MRATHSIITTFEGELSEVLNAKPTPIPTLAEVLNSLAILALAVSNHPAFANNQHAQLASDEALLILLALNPA